MGKRRTASGRGFSLIELLIVIAILGIISTIAIPVLLSARTRAIDAKAVSSLRAVVSGEYAYYARHGEFGTLAQLASPPNGEPRFLDDRFVSGDLGNEIKCSLIANGEHFRAECFGYNGVAPYHVYTANDTGMITETQN